MNPTAIHLYSNLDNGTGSTKHAELNLTSVSRSDSYIIKGMSGLDLDSVSHRYFSNGSVSGFDYYNVVSEPRVVVLAIRLNPQYQLNETANSLRANLQKMVAFTRNSLIELRFMENTTHIASLNGHITKFEASLFSSDPEVQITFHCEEPLLLSPTYTSVSVSPSRSDTKTWSDNLSTSAHGFKMEIKFPTPTVNFITIQGISGTTKAPFSFGIDTPWVNTILHFSSEKNNRYLYWTASGNTQNIMNLIEPFSVWPMMYPGETSISINTNITNNFIFESITYKNAYWGL